MPFPSETTKTWIDRIREVCPGGPDDPRATVEKALERARLRAASDLFWLVWIDQKIAGHPPELREAFRRDFDIPQIPNCDPVTEILEWLVRDPDGAAVKRFLLEGRKVWDEVAAWLREIGQGAVTREILAAFVQDIRNLHVPWDRSLDLLFPEVPRPPRDPPLGEGGLRRPLFEV